MRPAFGKAGVPWPDLQGTKHHLPPSRKMPSALCHLDARSACTQLPRPFSGAAWTWLCPASVKVLAAQIATKHAFRAQDRSPSPSTSPQKFSRQSQQGRVPSQRARPLQERPFPREPLRACAWPSAEPGRAGGGGVSSFCPHPPRGAGPEPGGPSPPRLLSRQLQLKPLTPGQGTQQQGLLQLRRSGSARGQRDASGRRDPSGPAAQRGPRGRPGAAAAAAATDASAKRYRRGTGWGSHPLSGRAKAPHGSQAVAGLGPPSPSASGGCALGREGLSLGPVHFPLPELGGGVCLSRPRRAGRAVHCSFVSEKLASARQASCASIPQISPRGKLLTN